MKKTITCTVCPNGCLVEAEYTCKEDLVLTGYGCKRGIKYCEDECFAPKRTFTSSVRINGAGRAMMPVRTNASIDKDMLMRCADEVHTITVEAPVKNHEVIRENFLGTGADLIATMTLERED